jgi:antitoxin (DNA-binding transcriptional repressor) of toxin-antitoxin stability system
MTERHLTVLEARRGFGNLVLDALAGNTTIITRYGKPAAAITPVPESAHSRTVGLPTGGAVTVTISGPVLNLSSEDREWLFNLIDLFKAHEADLLQTCQTPGVASSSHRANAHVASVAATSGP